MVGNQKKTLIIGVTPPPIGGVSIHLSRLHHRLQRLNMNVLFWDYTKETLIAGIKKIVVANVVHTNFSNAIARCFFTIFLRLLNKKVIVTFHGKYSFSNVFDLITLKALTYGLVLNDYSLNHAIQKVKNVKKIRLISAFIPPIGQEDEMSNEARVRLQLFRARYEYIACSNAHNYVLDSEGKDLYGIDFLLKVFVTLDRIGLIISDPSGKLASQYKSYQGIDNILFISEPHSFVEIIKISNIVVRATTTDGDSLSVKEALYFGRRVIATDCVNRPSGCELYKVNDVVAFRSLLFEFNNSNKNESVIMDGTDQILEVYRVCQKNIERK